MSQTARFEFGRNWASFLATIDAASIEQATDSLRCLLGGADFSGRQVLDLGCGSGLFSLAMHHLGADVTSIDADPESVQCTIELRRRRFTEIDSKDPPKWHVAEGSVLDEAFMETLGTFDVVYSWGVLHHTGEMDRALHLAAKRVSTNGQLALAIYNDQGGGSRRWLAIKRGYHRVPVRFRPVYVGLIAAICETKFALARLASGHNPLPFADWRAKRRDRGMSVWHDWVDWIGGLPFEVAKPEKVILPLLAAGFRLENLTTVGSGWGCNEYVFRRSGKGVGVSSSQ